MKTSFKKGVMVSAALLMTLDLVGCAKTNEASRLNIQLQLGSYSTAQNKIKNPFLKLLEVNEAQAAVSSLKMCFKRLRFKPVDENTAAPETSEDNIDFAIGEVTVDASGASLGSISLPAGTYRRIEFDLDTDCASGKSIQLVNSSGSYSSNQRMTIKFSGTFDANADGTLTLGVQTILNALNSYNGGDLKTTVESISGELSN